LVYFYKQYKYISICSNPNLLRLESICRDRDENPFLSPPLLMGEVR